MRALLSESLTIERVTVAIADLPTHLQGTTLVQLSDFHFDGQSLSQALLTAAIAHCNALHPDLVVLTGDFITDDVEDIHRLTPFLHQLQSRFGRYAVLGNHDARYPQWQHTICRALVAAQVHPLWNEIAYPVDDELPLVGIADLQSRECDPAQLLAQLPPDTPRIVLAHNPDTLDRMGTARADLVLSGHTHGGQVVLPGGEPLPKLLRAWGTHVPTWGRPFIPWLNQDCDRVFRHWEWASGWHRVGQKQLYVNRGLGSYFPGRWSCPPELTVITLTCL